MLVYPPKVNSLRYFTTIILVDQAITTLDGLNEKIEWSHLDASHISTIFVIPGV